MQPAGVIERINKKFTKVIAKRLKKLNWLSPNHITWLSFILAGVIAPWLIFEKKLRLAAGAVLLGAWLDSLDGDLAREKGVSSREGAILDAVLDRYIDLFILGSLTYLYAESCLLAGLLAMIGTALVPYVRAKVEAVGKSSVSTFASRDIRNVIIVIGLLIKLPCLLLWSIAILTNLSALHRFIKGMEK